MPAFGRRNLSDYSRGLACSISALPDGLPAREFVRRGNIK